jgi:hypothetical protein
MAPSPIITAIALVTITLLEASTPSSTVGRGGREGGREGGRVGLYLHVQTHIELRVYLVSLCLSPHSWHYNALMPLNMMLVLETVHYYI